MTGSAAKALESKELFLHPNLDKNRIKVTEAGVKVDQQDRVKVLVEKHEIFPVLLEGGTATGVLLPMGVISPV